MCCQSVSRCPLAVLPNSGSLWRQIFPTITDMEFHFGPRRRKWGTCVLFFEREKYQAILQPVVFLASYYKCESLGGCFKFMLCCTSVVDTFITLLFFNGFDPFGCGIGQRGKTQWILILFLILREISLWLWHLLPPVRPVQETAVSPLSNL